MEDIDAVTGFVFQLEEGENGTPHFQGYIELSKRMYTTGVQSLLAPYRMSLLHANGTKEQNWWVKMYFSDKALLRTETIVQDADGFNTVTTSDVEVWADKKSVKRTEFYMAQSAGIEVTTVFEVSDYSNEKVIVYQGKVYDIIRAYQNGSGPYELTCSDRRV